MKAWEFCKPTLLMQQGSRAGWGKIVRVSSSKIGYWVLISMLLLFIGSCELRISCWPRHEEKTAQDTRQFCCYSIVCPKWYAGKCDVHFSNHWFVMFSNFTGVNIHIIYDFKLEHQAGKIIFTIGSHQLIYMDPGCPCHSWSIWLL